MMEDELVRRDFDPNNFVKSRWKPGGDDVRKLRELRAQIQSLADESAQVVKKNVFQNYTQFIATAKQISHLETEMYQLSHLLTEQKSLIESMMELSLTGVKDKTTESTSHTAGKHSSVNVVQQLLEKVENCSHMTENPNREILLESDLTELNFDTLMPVHQVHAFLLTDGLMLTSLLPHSLGTGTRFKFDSWFQLENLALINVKEEGATNNIFKLLVFPEHKLFQCENARMKKKWMDMVDNAKKRMLREGSLLRQATIRLKKEKESSPASQAVSLLEGKPGITEENLASEMEYLKELPDELDACIAQRDFDNAVDILYEGRDNLQECPDAAFVRELREKLDQKQQQLVDVLCKELKNSSDKNLQGGPKAARKAMTLLIKLGKSSQACDLYLKNRSAFIKHGVRELKIVDNQLNYTKQLTKIVCGNLIDVGREFLRFFSQNPSCFSVLSLWASGELKNYVNLIVRHVFDSAPSLSILGQCLQVVHSASEELADVGLDLSFELEKLLESHLERSINENKRNLVEAIKLRIAEDKWRPYNLQSENSLRKFIEELKEVGINLEQFICSSSTSGAVGSSKEQCFLWLTSQTCHFTRSVLPFSRDSALMRLGHHMEQCDEALTAVWRLELDHISNSIIKYSAVKDVVERNAKFLLQQLLPMCESAYRKGGGMKNWTHLRDLVNEYPNLSQYRSKLNDIDKFESVGDV